MIYSLALDKKTDETESERVFTHIKCLLFKTETKP